MTAVALGTPAIGPRGCCRTLEEMERPESLILLPSSAARPSRAGAPPVRAFPRPPLAGLHRRPRRPASTRVAVSSVSPPGCPRVASAAATTSQATRCLPYRKCAVPPSPFRHLHTICRQELTNCRVDNKTSRQTVVSFCNKTYSNSTLQSHKGQFAQNRYGTIKSSEINQTQKRVGAQITSPHRG